MTASFLNPDEVLSKIKHSQELYKEYSHQFDTGLGLMSV